MVLGPERLLGGACLGVLQVCWCLLGLMMGLV